MATHCLPQHDRVSNPQWGQGLFPAPQVWSWCATGGRPAHQCLMEMYPHQACLCQHQGRAAPTCPVLPQSARSSTLSTAAAMKVTMKFTMQIPMQVTMLPVIHQLLLSLGSLISCFMAHRCWIRPWRNLFMSTVCCAMCAAQCAGAVQLCGSDSSWVAPAAAPDKKKKKKGKGPLDGGEGAAAAASGGGQQDGNGDPKELDPEKAAKKVRGIPHNYLQLTPAGYVKGCCSHNLEEDMHSYGLQLILGMCMTNTVLTATHWLGHCWRRWGMWQRTVRYIRVVT